MKPLPGRIFEATDVNLVIWKYYFFFGLFTWQQIEDCSISDHQNFKTHNQKYLTAGVLNLLVLVNPQIKNSTQMSFFWVVFKILRTPCELLTYPRLRTAALLHINKKSQNYTFEIYYICWLFRDINITTPQCLGFRCCVCVGQVRLG